MRSIRLILSIALFAGAASSCSRQTALPSVGPALQDEPIIRVRVARTQPALTLKATKSLLVTAMTSGAAITVQPPLTIAFADNQWRINSKPVIALGTDALDIHREDEGAILLGDRLYPQTLRIWPRHDMSLDAQNRRLIDVVNLVHMEAYLPGVLDKELYDHWQLTTHQAQAIAARSYAIYQLLHRSRGKHYDVEATQQSQAYIGMSSNIKAIQAVLDTTGRVLTWQDQIIPGYYNSTCGGAGVSPAEAWGSTNPYPPLEPRPHRAWDKDSPYARWGPIKRNLGTLRQRMVAWGASRQHALAKIGFIRNIAIDKNNAVGRPVRFVVTDHLGKTYTLDAEAFRGACNYGKPTTLKSGDRLKSSYVSITIRGNVAEFSGRGFGHGVGLCQYGAEAMARAGRDVMEILDTYYPHATVERAY